MNGVKAIELGLAGVDVLVVDQLPDRAVDESRAGGMHPHSMEMLDHRGILAPFLAAGTKIQAGHFSGLPMDFAALPTRYPFTLNLLQSRTEALLEQRAAELGIAVRWSAGVTGYRQDAEGITVDLADGAHVTARYLVGCDGGRSSVRHVLGFEDGWWRLLLSDYGRIADRSTPIDFDEFRETFVLIVGRDYGMRSPRWVSRFSDAAHIHFPAGGQGLNTGLQDAMNLGWKLAVLRGADEELLDTYEAERHPVAERVVRNTRAQTALARPGQHATDLRSIMTDLIGLRPVNEHLAGMIGSMSSGHGAIWTGGNCRSSARSPRRLPC